jgi:hypothetical protein
LAHFLIIDLEKEITKKYKSKPEKTTGPSGVIPIAVLK